jgi:hypothetical protein
MAIRRQSSGDAAFGPVRANWLKVSLGRLAVVAIAGLALVNVAGKRDLGSSAGGGRRGQQPATPAASAVAAPAMPTTLTKSLAIDALVQALAVNSSPTAEKTLEQMVTGEIPFGGHAKQAAQKAMMNLVLRSAMQPSPESEAFLARIFSDPDESIRTGDQGAYPAADLRNDTALVIARIGSPGLRLALAKIYTQPSTLPATRAAIENVVRARVPANFAAQVEVFRGAETPDLLKSALQKSLIKQNEAAVKAALKLPTEEKGKPAAAGGTPFSPMAASTKSKTSAAPSGGGLFDAVGKLFGGGSSGPGAAGSPFAAMASMSPAEMKEIVANVQKRMEAAAAKGRKPGAAPAAPTVSPDVMLVEIFGEIQNRQPVDLGVVAKSLWNAEFADSVANNLSEGKGDAAPTINALASLPTKAAREKLKEILHKQRTKGPEELAKMETATAAETPAASAAGGRRKNKKDGAGPATPSPRGGMRFGMGAQNQLDTKKLEVVEFGTDWYDPGSLVVLKSVVSYAERPPEKPTHHSMRPQQPRRMSAAMEKRMQDKVDKQKALEATYEWRDAIEKAVRQWDERLAAVAEEPPASGDKTAADDEKSDAAAKTAKSGSTAAPSPSKSSGTKTPVAAPPPSPAVKMPFAMFAGETIAKEYHQRWPQDLSANLGNSASTAEPLAFDYVRLEEKGQSAKTLTHYQNALTSLSGSKPKITRRKIENGTWLDYVQKDETSHRTRSVDVIVTKEASDDDKKAGGDAQITVEILFVEIETPGGDVSPSHHGKKEAPETTSTTPP